VKKDFLLNNKFGWQKPESTKEKEKEMNSDFFFSDLGMRKPIKNVNDR